MPFTQSYVEIPERDNEHIISPELPYQLKEEASGILAWLIQGALLWREQGLNPPNIVRTATESYRIEEDEIGQFISERCMIDPDSSETAGNLYRVYKIWAENSGMRPLTSVMFSRRLRVIFNRDDSRRHVVYRGLRLIVPI